MMHPGFISIFRRLWAKLLPVFGAAVASLFATAGAGAENPAVPKDSGLIAAWASRVVEYVPGKELVAQWMDSREALGKAEGNYFDVLSLGQKGQVTLSFDRAIYDGSGWDFAVFENGMSATYLEFAYVEVSSDGSNWVRFPNHSDTLFPVGAYGPVNGGLVEGLAGKYPQGVGTGFDLAELRGRPDLDINSVRYVRLVDVCGDGSCLDSDGRPIFDPYPVSGAAGFDVDAVGARYLVEDMPQLTVSASNGQVMLSWDTTSGFVYELQWSPDMEQWSTVRTYSGTGSTINHSEVAADTPRFYRVLRRAQ